MLMREGLYPDNSAAQGQILRLSRYRAARIGVDVNLHTGRWSFEQAVKYFMEAGGLDREAAAGEAAGAASSPSQKIRSEEHTSELQSPCNLVCRLLLEKKKEIKYTQKNSKSQSTYHTRRETNT